MLKNKKQYNILLMNYNQILKASKIKKNHITNYKTIIYSKKNYINFHYL